MKILRLEENTKEFVSKLVEFYAKELGNLSEKQGYKQEDREKFTAQKNMDYFQGIAEGKDSEHGVEFAVDEKGELEGTIEYRRYSDDYQEGTFQINEIMWVLASKKGQGAGSQLIKHFIDESREEGNADIIGLGVKKSNKRAMSLYEKLGFKRSVKDRNDETANYGLVLKKGAEVLLGDR